MHTQQENKHLMLPEKKMTSLFVNDDQAFLQPALRVLSACSWDIIQTDLLLSPTTIVQLVGNKGFIAEVVRKNF